jgi:hypothetical protein
MPRPTRQTKSRIASFVNENIWLDKNMALGRLWFKVNLVFRYVYNEFWRMTRTTKEKMFS